VPRASQIKSSGERLSDRVAIGVVAGVPSVSCGRSLSPHGLAMCLFSGQGYEEVARVLTEGRALWRWRGEWTVPSTAIWKARSRLGVELMKEPFAAVCRPIGARDTRTCSSGTGG
jgi:hypothetical protein